MNTCSPEMGLRNPVRQFNFAICVEQTIKVILYVLCGTASLICLTDLTIYYIDEIELIITCITIKTGRKVYLKKPVTRSRNILHQHISLRSIVNILYSILCVIYKLTLLKTRRSPQFHWKKWPFLIDTSKFEIWQTSHEPIKGELKIFENYVRKLEDAYISRV